MSRDLLLRFVDERASLAEDDLEALARALAGDQALRREARAQLATHELLDRVLSPERRDLAARVVAALAIDAALQPPPPSRPSSRSPATPPNPQARPRSSSPSARDRLRSLRPLAVAMACAAALLIFSRLWSQSPPFLAQQARPRVVEVVAAHRNSGDRHAPLLAGDLLDERDQIAVEPTGHVDLAYADGSTLRLTGERPDDEALLEVRRIGPYPIDPDPWWTPPRRATAVTRKVVTLLRGRLDAHVMPQQKSSPFTVVASAARCFVVGTRFTVVDDGLATRLSVREGAVDMVGDHEEETVHAGESATMTSGSDATPIAAAPRSLGATPATLAAALGDLRAGDKLTLAAGDYGETALTLGELRGKPEAWITISGPDRGEAVLHARLDTNTIEIGGAHHLALRRLTFDGGHRRGAYAIAAHENGPTHDIRIEDCVIRDYGGWPGAVAISSKRPAWSWTIRGCVIERCGAGLHLGGFDERAPFAAGEIVGNRISTDERCAIEIIAGDSRPDGAPAAARTLIADDVLTREPGSPPSPLVTLEGLRATGASRERIELARDVFLGDRGTAALLLAAGALDVHDCLFAGAEAAAIALRTRGAPTDARIWHDTVVACAQGVHVPEDAHRTLVAHCLICADDPVVGLGVTTAACRLAPRADAPDLVVDATPSFGALDLHPRLPVAQVDAWDARALDLDGRDFDGDARADAEVPGAYAGAATPRSWRVAAQRKPTVDR